MSYKRFCLLMTNIFVAAILVSMSITAEPPVLATISKLALVFFAVWYALESRKAGDQ